jgi:hypothetical protein
MMDGSPDGQSTLEGWPTEKSISLKWFNRVLSGWRSFDPEVERSNFDRDSDMLFTPSYPTIPIGLRPKRAGQPVLDCFYEAQQTAAAAANSP